MEIYLEECVSSLEDLTFDGVSLDVFTSPIEPYSDAEAVEEATASPLKPQSKVEVVLEAAAKPMQPHQSLIEALALEMPCLSTTTSKVRSRLLSLGQ